MNHHPHMILERQAALAGIASHLHHMIAHLRAAQYYNHLHGLNLDLPDEKPLLDLLGVYSHKYRQSSEQA